MKKASQRDAFFYVQYLYLKGIDQAKKKTESIARSFFKSLA